MKRFRAILLVSAAAAAVTVTTGGSSYAAGTPAPAPAGVTSVDFQNDMTGCGARHLHNDVAPADSING
jgi:hypothetical protein